MASPVGPATSIVLACFAAFGGWGTLHTGYFGGETVSPAESLFSLPIVDESLQRDVVHFVYTDINDAQAALREVLEPVPFDVVDSSVVQTGGPEVPDAVIVAAGAADDSAQAQVPEAVVVDSVDVGAVQVHVEAPDVDDQAVLQQVPDVAADAVQADAPSSVFMWAPLFVGGALLIDMFLAVVAGLAFYKWRGFGKTSKPIASGASVPLFAVRPTCIKPHESLPDEPATHNKVPLFALRPACVKPEEPLAEESDSVCDILDDERCGAVGTATAPVLDNCTDAAAGKHVALEDYIPVVQDSIQGAADSLMPSVCASDTVSEHKELQQSAAVAPSVGASDTVLEHKELQQSAAVAPMACTQGASRRLLAAGFRTESLVTEESADLASYLPQQVKQRASGALVAARERASPATPGHFKGQSPAKLPSDMQERINAALLAAKERASPGKSAIFKGQKPANLPDDLQQRANAALQRASGREERDRVQRLAEAHLSAAKERASPAQFSQSPLEASSHIGWNAHTQCMESPTVCEELATAADNVGENRSWKLNEVEEGSECADSGVDVAGVPSPCRSRATERKVSLGSPGADFQ